MKNIKNCTDEFPRKVCQVIYSLKNNSSGILTMKTEDGLATDS